MKTLFTGTIRRMAVVAVIVSILPPLAVLLFSGMQRFHEAHEEVARRGLRAVTSIAERQKLITGNTLTILSALLNVAALQEFSPEASGRLFQEITAEHPLFNNIFLMTPSGAVISSGVPVPQTMSLAATPLQIRAVRSDGSVLLPYAESPFTGVPVMQYTLPMTNSRGMVYAYLGAELQLRFLDRVFEGQNLPYTSTFHILSDSGTLLLSSAPEAPVRAGQFIGAELWGPLKGSNAPSGMFSYEEDGEPRIAMYTRLVPSGGNTPYLYTVMTLPENEAYALPHSIMHRDLLLLACGGFLALVAGLFICRRGFSVPVRTLLGVAARISRGDLSTRLHGPIPRKGEFAELGREFNAMAQSLEDRSAELEHDREAAAKSSRAKSEFLANMSHEIRTPMNAILGMAHLVERTNLSATQRLQVGKIHDAADALLRLLNNILDYSKMEAGKMQMERIPFHMGRLLNTVRSSGAERAKAAGTPLVTNISAAAPPLLLGDPTRLGQALSLLLEEAIRHSQGHPVEIGCRAEGDTGLAVTLHFTKTVHGVRLDPESLADMARCFSGQSAAVSHLDSAELGLLLAGSILRLMGGQATAENLENGFVLSGTVRLALPESGYEAQTLRFDGERVLLLGNQSGTPVARVRGQFRELLQRYNLRAEECDAIEEAVERLTEADRQGHPFAMVVADIPHASSDALHYIERLKHGLALSRPPLLVLTTGQDLGRLPPELLGSGIDAFLPRPINESLLVNTFSGLIRDRAGAGDGPDQNENGLAEDVRLDGLSVLLVEDNAVNREIAVELLQGAGVTVHCAVNGIEAVEACRRQPPPFDLALMDLEMPAMGGLEATRAVREQLGLKSWRLPIIAMTAHNSPEEVAACLEAGMNDHILKPLVLSQFFGALRRWLPPDAEHGEMALCSLRKMRHILLRSHPRDAELADLLDSLVPWLRQGRVDALRHMLEQQDSGTALAMMDDYLARPDIAHGAEKQDSP